MSRNASRRGFLIGTAAVAGAIATSSKIGFRAARTPRAAFLFDDRYEEARRFARLSAALGTKPTAVAENILSQAAELFYPLQDVAGLTSYADFTLAAGVARGLRRELIFHAYHLIESPAQVRYRVFLQGREASASPLRRSGRVQWESRLASCLLGSARHAASENCLPYATPGVGITLHSWVIAPGNS